MLEFHASGHYGTIRPALLCFSLVCMQPQCRNAAKASPSATHPQVGERGQRRQRRGRRAQRVVFIQRQVSEARQARQHGRHAGQAAVGKIQVLRQEGQCKGRNVSG